MDKYFASFSNIYTTVFRRVKRLNNGTWSVRLFNCLTGKAMVWMVCNLKPSNITSKSHGSLRVIKLQPRFKVCNISYLLVLFHSSLLLLTFWYNMYINHTKIKGKEWIHVTMINILALLLLLFLHVSQSENVFKREKHQCCNIMVSVLTFNEVDHGFESQLRQTNSYNIGMCCFSH